MGRPFLISIARSPEGNPDEPLQMRLGPAAARPYQSSADPAEGWLVGYPGTEKGAF